MEIRMKSSNFVFFLIVVGFSLTFGEDSSETENVANASSKSTQVNTQRNDSETLPMQKSFRGRQRQPEHLITPDHKLLIRPRLYYSEFQNEGSVIPHLGFSDGNRKQNIHLSNPTGQYDLELRNLQQRTPSNFQAALGAISAHIISQKRNEEYIPYPPNGDPYNYPAYRGNPRATEPPVVRAYERASNANYDVQTTDIDQRNPRRLYSFEQYPSGFSDQFQNFEFHSHPDFFQDSVFYSDPRANTYSVQEFGTYDQGEEYRRPIK